MPFPINATHRLLLESGSYLLLEDNSSKFILDEAVALDDPLDAATGISTTPALTFVGESLIQTGTGGAIIDSYSETNQNATLLIDGSTFNKGIVGQSITGTGVAVGAAQFYLMQAGATGTLTAKIYAHTGTFGTSSLTSGAALAVSNAVNVTTISSSLSLVTFTFSGANQITLTNGTNYVLAIDATAAAGGTSIGVDTTSPTHAGNESEANSGSSTTTANAGTDVCFYIYDNAAIFATRLNYEVQIDTVNTFNSATLLDRNSTINAGFVDDILSGGNDRLLLEDGTSFLLLEDNSSKLLINSQFLQGDYVTYTVQAADFLFGGVLYYWRVRYTTAAGYVSPWSETRTFTTTRPTSDYWYGAFAALPTDNSRLTFQYTPTQVTNVANIANTTDVNDVSNQAYRVHQWASFQASPGQLTATYKGKAGQATSGRNAVLQVYNNVTPGWETLATDSSTSAGATLNLSGTINATFAPYYDGNNYIYFRVYQ